MMLSLPQFERDGKTERFQDVRFLGIGARTRRLEAVSQCYSEASAEEALLFYIVIIRFFVEFIRERSEGLMTSNVRAGLVKLDRCISG